LQRRSLSADNAVQIALLDNNGLQDGEKLRSGFVPKAIVRMQVEKIDGVTRTWFEWSVDPDDVPCRTLVVEVDFSTDPNEDSFRQSVIDAIEATTDEIVAHETAVVFHALRIVPKDRPG
jgi:hypothetical protein